MSIQIGAVMFDNREVPGVGWACRAGELPVRITGVQALSSDTLWLVNVSIQQMRESGLSEHAFYRGDDFLRLSVRGIMQELGLINDEGEVIQPDQAARIMADLFENQVQLFCAMTGMSRERWKPPRYIFRAAIRGAMMRPDERLDPLLLEAVKESNQTFTRCRTTGRSGTFGVLNGGTVFLPIPRVNHAVEVLKCPVPMTTEYERVKAPNSLASIPDWLNEQQAPMLIKATVENFPPSISKLINFGAIANVQNRMSKDGYIHQETSTRQWITSDEARLFANFADLTIHDAIRFPKWTLIGEALGPVANWLEKIEPIDHLSYSLGLFMENVWTGLTVDLEANFADKAVSANILAPFLRTADRIGCFQRAIGVANQGYEVMGYGVGRVGFFLKDGAAAVNDEALRVAAAAELVPPFPMAGAGAMPSPPILSETEEYRTLVDLIASDMRSEFLEVDQEVVSSYVNRQPQDSSLEEHDHQTV